MAPFVLLIACIFPRARWDLGAQRNPQVVADGQLTFQSRWKYNINPAPLSGCLQTLVGTTQGQMVGFCNQIDLWDKQVSPWNVQ